MKKILVMGLSGAGKTTFAKSLVDLLLKNNKTVTWFNADIIRKLHHDWDFSLEGRLRQSVRMTALANESKSDYVICDFIAPLVEMRNNFKSDYTVWMDTIVNSNYSDTDRIFVPPSTYDMRIREKDSVKWSDIFFNVFLKNEGSDFFDI